MTVEPAQFVDPRGAKRIEHWRLALCRRGGQYLDAIGRRRGARGDDGDGLQLGRDRSGHGEMYRWGGDPTLLMADGFTGDLPAGAVAEVVNGRIVSVRES